MMKVWISGESTPTKKVSWEFGGVFSTEELAIAACTKINHFVAEVTLNENLNCFPAHEFPNSYYPLAEEE